jgi:hypothetical protein
LLSVALLQDSLLFLSKPASTNPLRKELPLIGFMGLWKHSFRKAFIATALLLLVLAIYLLAVPQKNENMQKNGQSAQKNAFSGSESQENSDENAFSLLEVSAEFLHESEAYTVSGIKVEIADSNQPG